jgi:hypothetical protein
VEHEVDRLPVVLLHQLGELEHGLVEGVAVVELAGTLQGDGLGSGRRDAERGRDHHGDRDEGELPHGPSSSLVEWSLGAS